jgi:hypothetical protein
MEKNHLGHRGNYWHRYFIRANQNRIDPDQDSEALDLISTWEMPPIPAGDPEDFFLRNSTHPGSGSPIQVP